MKTRKILSVITFLILANSFFAQQQSDKTAFAGPNGIFINTGVEIPFQNSGDNKLFKYKIERSAADKEYWIEIASLGTPVDFKSFVSKLNFVNSELQDSIPVNELPLELIWEKANTYQRLDSMKHLGNPLNVKLALGVCYLDKQIELNKEYIYRISKLDNNGEVVQLFTSNKMSYPSKFENDLLKVNDRELSDSFIRIKWKSDNFNPPARFKVYRRENFGNNFAEIFPVRIYNSEDSKISITIVDTSIKSDQTYEYFLRPVDYYQNEGTASDTVLTFAFAFNKIFPPYDISVVSEDSIDGLKLSWKFADKDKIVSLAIYRSISSDSGFAEIGEVSGFDSVYSDLTAEPLVLYYYYLKLNDPLNEVPLQSAKVFGLYKSKDKPQPPIEIIAESTEEGIKLSWNKSNDFVDTYHIYRNPVNDDILSEYFILRSRDSVLQFIDSVAELSGNRVYYYSIKSETNSGLLSEFSDTVSIVPQIKITIEPPRQLVGSLSKGEVNLYWENLFENNESIEGYRVYRKELTSSNSDFVALFDSLLPPKQNNYVDTLVVDGNSYEYSVKVFDIFHNESALSSSVIINLDPIPILPASGLSAVNTNSGVLLSWQTQLQENISEYKVYRYKRGDEPKVIGSVKDGVNEFLDQSAITGSLYFYYITVIDSKSEESQPSEELGIRR